MFLIQPLLALLGAFAVFVNGYEGPGSYERLVFYYAYLMDAATNDGKPKTFAPRCTPSDSKNKLCSLNDFIKFIAADQDLGTFSVTDTKPPNVPPLDETADNIFNGRTSKNKKLTDPITLGRVWEKFPGSDYDSLLAKTASYIQGKAYSSRVDDDLKKQAKYAISSVYELRREASTNSFFQNNPDLEKKVKDPQPIHTDSERTVSLINPGATAEANDLTSKELQKMLIKDMGDGHIANIKVLKDALEEMDC